MHITLSDWLIHCQKTVCTGVFAVEVLLKLFAHGVIDYFGEGWNVFDFFVVGVAIAERAFETFAGALVKGSLFRVARLARAARVHGAGAGKPPCALWCQALQWS